MWGTAAEKKDKNWGSVFEDGAYTFLGKGVDFKGKAKFDTSVRIDGHFDGQIVSQDTLMIGESGIVKGEITCETIISSGKIEGNIVASQKVQLLKPAVLIGGVRAPSFSVEEGVVFHGMCDMGVSGLEDVAPETGKPAAKFE
ncbi:MAG: polymer-forming cytoskeletal protein [Nitrospira sp. SB0678_bin_10]|nr:polymer-forming cytoskeletal protein [Nitrospira sp. SB0678_bin_10]